MRGFWLIHFLVSCFLWGVLFCFVASATELPALSTILAQMLKEYNNALRVKTVQMPNEGSAL